MRPLLALALLLAAGCGSSGSHGWLPDSAVRGSFQGALPDGVTASRVYCQWDNGHIDMHIRFTNHGYGEQDQTVQYMTRYQISGQNHGDSIDNQESHTIPAGQSVDENDDAGTPSGVSENAPISACIPGD